MVRLTPGPGRLHQPVACGRIAAASGSDQSLEDGQMVEFEGVSRWFGPVQAVCDVSFKLRAGEVVGLVGPNGAGKTTTLRMMTGYLPPSEGRILIENQPLDERPVAARRNLGYMPEHTPLYPEMRVCEFLDFRGKLMGMARRARRLRMEWAIERCGLMPVRRRVISAISRGNRQRVGLAAALLHDPKVLVLDEPTAGLDPVQIQEVRKLLEELRPGRTILISSHILPELERTVDRVLVISQGRLSADGTIAELSQRGTDPACLLLRIRGSRTQWEACIQGLGINTQRIEEQTDCLCIELIPPDERSMHELLGRLAQTKLPLIDLTRRKLSLEEVFSSMTEQNVAAGRTTDPSARGFLNRRRADEQCGTEKKPGGGR
ncbi:MAG: ABC transporter ATP-binding protein [Phycisphaeraceae bacterium]|nr:ABC transporter ATP-binding protein [Phycisphaeraceae bacterium]